MEFAGHRISNHFVLGLFLISIFLISGCGDSGPDRVGVTPAEKTLEVGDSFQFKATAWAKNKELSNLTFEWQVEGEAGTVDNSGQFSAQKPGEAVIIAKTGIVTGKGRVLVKSKPVAERSPEPEKKMPTVQLDVSGLKAVITLDSQEFKTRKKVSVSLSHLKHINEYGVTCTECHHEYKDGKNIWTQNDPVKRCVDCHDPEETKDGVMKLQNAYHKNCKDCHKSMVEEGKSEIAPYKKCTDCHKE